MQLKKHLFALLIVLLTTGILSAVVYFSNQYYSKTYNAAVQLTITNLAYIMLGIILGIIHITRQYNIYGKWKIDKLQIAVFTIPFLVFYLILIFNVQNIFIRYHVVINSFFKDAIGIIIGYSFISSFYKK
ncbi:hypothetical protein SAMN02745221_00781 [Thermosyntropha lipolytica DSM 11003]|uniref:Uncharacterized protein n=1 Tax=Thermosyntropha lipolytica DSM 11003 TaxID=1123382 RepID=A0A1M5LXH2_9FIRM|nr:hypothetical protein [Thermosyntropha lipolytica]SHG69691.1 hypothetical protein SAMN02745221_00781 [Thermosyntropha lipolytica DSM 11003]